MNEPINIKINLMVNQTIRNHLEAKNNYAEYIRTLIELDMKKSKLLPQATIPLTKKKRKLV